eukprot:CAMPEP_0183749346 /NCGR_PEP_ID=MMETSP0737-20130205/68237_1 /TAXON_ID=385413 /ORGANISM="Thalassiosira miniscula, Strain CCMP1093" /LENGTH=495 /DNA_ID=CAMNT_0025985099 /DNA_START=521 /DNA_END=2008 /DNA_ORIENTATION=+
MTIRKTISFIVLVLFPLFEGVCHAHLFWKRNNLLIRKRNKAAIYVASLAGWLAYFNLVVSIFGGVPCGLFYVASLLVAPLSVGPQIIRAITLRGNIKYSHLVIEDEMSTRAERKKGAQLEPIASGSSDNGLSSPHQMTKMMEANLVIETTNRMVQITKWAMFLITVVLLVVALALSTDATQLLATDFEQCQPEPTYFQYFSPAFGITSTALALVVTILLKKIEDELGMRREIQRNAIFLGSTFIIILAVRFAGYHDWQPLLQTIQQMILFFSMAIIPFLPGTPFNNVASWARKRINPATKSAVPGYAQPLPMKRGSTRTSIQKVIPGRASRRQSMTALESEREVNVSLDAGLCILLSTENGINLFSQHCAREFSAENVRFWSAVNDYKSKFDEEKCISMSTEADEDSVAPAAEENDNKVDHKKDAEHIYNQFISQHSKTQVNLSSKQRSDIKKAIGSGELVKETFDAAQREIFSVMSRDSYPRFLASKKTRMTIR